MSGMEGPALAAGGGRLLGGLAVPAGRALARKMTFRWMVSRRVRKRVDLSCRWRTYRQWLKTITTDELARPVEEIQGMLANRLDQALSAATETWASTEGHLSNALRLVELTYPAIAAALGDGDREALTESWAQQRSVGVRDLLLQLAGPGAGLSAADLAGVLKQRSAARRTIRLQAFEIDEAALASYFEQVRVVDVPVGVVKVILGDFGSGKSEIAETWHRYEIDNLVAVIDPPLPVWLSARDLLGQTLEAAIERQLGSAWRFGPGASVTIDGLDETDPATAQFLLEAARTLTATYGNVRVLLTARPGTLAPTAEEEIAAPLLTEDEAIGLVEMAGGKPHATWNWTADMRATVTRPFFALAAGKMLGRGEAPAGEADLIRGLVEDALAKGTERSAITSGETRSVLERLALGLTRAGSDGLPFSQRQIARSSRLVADRRDGSVTFSLPIFQHWFAAQTILSGDVPASEIVSDAFSFNRWQWAAAVAVLSAPSTAVVDDLLATWVGGNPGAAAWIMNEAFSGQRDWRTEEDGDLDAKTSGPRLLRALRTWTDSLGPFADGVLPFLLVQGPVGLGVTASGHRLNVALSTSSPAADYVTEVPSGVHPLVPTQTEGWLAWISGAAPQGDGWPWEMVRQTIAKATLKKLSRDPFLGASDGIWVHERRFDLARRLAGRGSLFHGDLSASDVRAFAEKSFDAMGKDRNSQVSFGGSAPYSGAEIADLIAWIDGSGSEWVPSPLPERDVLNPTGGFIWDQYSPERLMQFEAEVYGQACEAYDEAIAHSFARLGWAMPSSAFAPFGVTLEFNFDKDARIGDIPTLTAMRVPMALMPQVVPSGAEVIWSARRRAAAIVTKGERADNYERHSSTIEMIRSWLAQQNREPLGGLGWSSTGADDMSEVRPISSVAAEWLWADLKSLGLGTGTFPQLR
jgi:hypothetical protein